MRTAFLRAAGPGVNEDYRKSRLAFRKLLARPRDPLPHVGPAERVGGEIGVEPRDRFADVIERALAVVVPSLGEGFGMVALEAMERRRPVHAGSSRR